MSHHTAIPGLDRDTAGTLGRGWLAAFRNLHPDVATAACPPGHRRGVDVYAPEDLEVVTGAGMAMFRSTHGRDPDPGLPITGDHFFADKIYLPVPIEGPNPADKLMATSFLTPSAAGLVRVPARPWISERVGLPPDDAVPPGDYYLKLSIGNSTNVPVTWPPTPGHRAELEATLRSWLVMRYGVAWGEWWYARGRRRLFLEERIGSRESPLLEAKIYVRRGRPVLGYAYEGHIARGKWMQYYDGEGRPIPGRQMGAAPWRHPHPATLPQMLDVAGAIGRDFERVRVDFFITDEPRPVLGEVTIGDLNARRVLDANLEPVACRALFG